jgi:hypothetical protein
MCPSIDLVRVRSWVSAASVDLSVYASLVFSHPKCAALNTDLRVYK